MSKNLPKRYLSEEAVKKALKIDSFRNLSKEKVMEFTSMIPYMDKDVAIAIINQFPRFIDFGKTMVASYVQVCNDILEKNKESQAAAIHGYQTILDALSKRLEIKDISEDERKSITNDMITVAGEIKLLDLQNKKFLDRITTKIGIGILAIFAISAAALGINSSFNGRGELPQLDDDENDEEDED